MPSAKQIHNEPYHLDFFLAGKSEVTLGLFYAFVSVYRNIAPGIEIIPAKTMIGVAAPKKRIAWITQLGKNFLHVVFPFDQPYEDNLCFQKIAQVPGNLQYNHHLRIFGLEDINEEVRSFMELAYQKGS